MTEGKTRPGGLIDDRFLLLQRLGGGGAATVWHATDLTTGREVALKLLHPKYRGIDEAHERLAREAALLASFKHPNIARAYAFELERVQPYFVMSLINGDSLEDELAARAGSDRFFEWSELLRMAAQIADAVDYAHQRGVIHRDLKPSNIMLDDTRRPPEVRILDFGIAKLVSGSARNPTTHGRVMGTGFYMAPEQARGEKIDARADLFAFGVLLFEMITLRRTWVRNDRGGPIRAFAEPARRNEFNTPTAILNRIAHETRPLVSDFRPGLPPALDKVITWALAIEPSARPSDASALFRALQEATQGMATVLTEPNPVAGMPTQPDGPASSLGPVDPTWSRSRAVITEFSGMERSGPTLALPTDNEPNETLALPAQNEVQVTQVSTDASIPSVAAVESGIGARDPTIALPPAASGIDAGEWADDGTLVQEDVVTTEPTRAMPEPALDRTPVIMARRPTGPSGAYRGARSSVFLADASPALKTTVVIMAMLTGAALLLLAGYQMGRQTVVIQAIPVDPKVEEARGEFPLIAPGRPEAVPSAALNEPMPARARPSSSPPKEAQPPSEARAPRQPSRRRRTPPAPDPLDDLHRLMNEIRADAQDLEAVRKLGAEIEARARAVSDRTERARIQRIAQSSALLGDIEGIEQALDALTSALKSR